MKQVLPVQQVLPALASWTRRVSTGALCFGALVMAAGCASSSKPKPTPLEDFTPTIAAKQVWKQSVGKVRFPLTLATTSNAFVVGDDGGRVAAFDAQSGSPQWQVDVGDKLTAGVGTDGRFSAVVTRANELVVIEGGKVAWRKPLPSQVVTAPLVAGERVFVLALDRGVHAFDALDGRKLWSFQRPSDALTLSHPGVLMAFKDTLVAGQGAKLVGLDPVRGTARWEVTAASPRGTNEVERLADLVAPAVRIGDAICARAFQVAVGCVDAERASLSWARNTGGTDGVGANDAVVLAADASDRLTAWKRADGNVLWTAERLRHRGLSAPLAVDRAFVVGDSEGYVHWLSPETGDVLQRQRAGSDPIDAAPVRIGNTVLIVNRDGDLYAFRPE